MKTMRTKLVFVLVGVLLTLQTYSSATKDISAENQTPNSNGTQQATNNAEGTEDPHATESDSPTDSDAQANTDGTQTDSSAETVDGDQNPDNITGMSDSLVDYVLDLLTHSNTSSKEEGGARPAGNATRASGNDTGSGVHPEEARAQSGGHGAGTSSGREGAGAEASSAAAHLEKASESDRKGGGKHGHDQWSDDENFTGHTTTTTATATTTTTTTTQTSMSTTPKRRTVDCNKEVDLQDYCDFTPLARNAFLNHTDIEGLRAPFIAMDVVRDLMKCHRGEWCLGNLLDVFQDLQDAFYRSLLCDDSLWKCIFDVILLRESCLNDGEFLFVVDAVDLLCNLPSIPASPLQALTPSAEKDQTRCFAHVLAAVHVTYADFLYFEGPTPPEKDVACSGHGFKMTETYLCADMNCKGQYQARRAMEGFERWAWFMAHEDARLLKCKSLANDTCGPLQAKPTSSKPYTWFGMSTSSPLWTTTSFDIAEGGGNMQTIGEEDKSLMIALSVGSAVGLLFLVLGLVFWRRSRRRSAYYYRSLSESYEKGASDEAHLLGRSTD